jgi:hypothetical protein
MDYYSATNPAANDDQAEKERGVEQRLKWEQRRARRLALLEQRKQAQEKKNTDKKDGSTSAKPVKKNTKDWAINSLLPKWGFFRWCRARFRGDAMDARSIAELLVVLFGSIRSCLTSTVIVTTLILVIGWLLGGMAFLYTLYNIGRTVLGALVDLLTNAGGDIAA